MERDIAKAFSDLNNKVNTAQKKLNEILSGKCETTANGLKATNESVAENNDAIMEVCEITSESSDCFDEMAGVLSEITDCMDELSTIISELDARVTALEGGEV